MENAGLMQGYYIGLFARFIKFLLIYFIIQSMMIYIFDYNWFTYWGLTIIFSFFINTSLPMKENYPFFRHGLVLLCLLLSLSHTANVLIKLHSFFYPHWLWITLLLISFLIGIATSFGKIGNGTYSKNIETFGNFFLFLSLIASFVLFWWKGGVMYTAFRFPLLFLETFFARMIMYFLVRRNDNNINYDSQG